jgi:3-deoxy-manno-octulosonate cytidylyltransferase (CMP-KDO synthetase)
MKTLGIIPARWNSSRFPGKMLFNVFGKTIIQHTWEQTKKASTLNRIIVATDSPEVFNECFNFGAEVVITSNKHKNGTKRCIEVLNMINEDYDIIVNIQGDEPNINPDIIDKLVMSLKDHPNCVCSTPISEITKEEAKDPNTVKCVFNLFKEAMYFSRQPIPHGGPWWGHIGVYAYRKGYLMNMKNQPTTPLQKSEDLEQLNILETAKYINVVPVQHKVIGIDVLADVKKFIKYYLNIV